MPRSVSGAATGSGPHWIEFRHGRCRRAWGADAEAADRDGAPRAGRDHDPRPDRVAVPNDDAAPDYHRVGSRGNPFDAGARSPADRGNRGLRGCHRDGRTPNHRCARCVGRAPRTDAPDGGQPAVGAEQDARTPPRTRGRGSSGGCLGRGGGHRRRGRRRLRGDRRAWPGHPRFPWRAARWAGASTEPTATPAGWRPAGSGRRWRRCSPRTLTASSSK